MGGFVGWGGANNNVGNFDRALYTFTGLSQTAGTTGASSIVGGGGRGSVTLVANAGKPNKIIEIEVVGWLNGTGASTHTVAVMLGSTTLASAALSLTTATHPFKARIRIAWVTTTLVHTWLEYVLGSSAAVIAANSFQYATYNTTVLTTSQALDVLATNSTSKISDTYITTIREC